MPWVRTEHGHPTEGAMNHAPRSAPDFFLTPLQQQLPDITAHILGLWGGHTPMQ